MKLINQKYESLANKYKCVPISQTAGNRKCDNCKSIYQVKFADLKRGYGKCCSKSCACIKQGGYSKAGYDIRESEYLKGEID